jgi:hypothetical protein
MRFGLFASILFVPLVACSSSSNNPAAPKADAAADTHNPVSSKADAAADTSSDPCGPSSRTSLPSCTTTLEGHYCSYEACECCTNGATCESGDWVNPTINNPKGSCPADGGHTFDSGRPIEAGKGADSGRVDSGEALDSGGGVDAGQANDSGSKLDGGHPFDAAKIVDSGAIDAAPDGAQFTCGKSPPDAGPGMQQFGTCAGLAKCCAGGIPGSYYCYAGDGGCPEVP